MIYDSNTSTVKRAGVNTSRLNTVGLSALAASALIAVGALGYNMAVANQVNPILGRTDLPIAAIEQQDTSDENSAPPADTETNLPGVLYPAPFEDLSLVFPAEAAANAGLQSDRSVEPNSGREEEVTQVEEPVHTRELELDNKPAQAQQPAAIQSGQVGLSAERPDADALVAERAVEPDVASVDPVEIDPVEIEVVEIEVVEIDPVEPEVVQVEPVDSATIPSEAIADEGVELDAMVEVEPIEIRIVDSEVVEVNNSENSGNTDSETTVSVNSASVNPEIEAIEESNSLTLVPTPNASSGEELATALIDNSEGEIETTLPVSTNVNQRNATNDGNDDGNDDDDDGNNRRRGPRGGEDSSRRDGPPRVENAQQDGADSGDSQANGGNRRGSDRPRRPRR